VHDDVNKIGGLLKAARDAKKMTQAELSRITDLATRTIMDIENDKHYPTYEVFFKIIHALDLPADCILWPGKTPYTQEQEQLMQAVSSCNEHDRAIFMQAGWAIVNAAKADENLK
jgi:transcriptional regulator with XRE-family HTH domain